MQRQPLYVRRIQALGSVGFLSGPRRQERAPANFAQFVVVVVVVVADIALLRSSSNITTTRHAKHKRDLNS
jgi:hypothetical protein